MTGTTELMARTIADELIKMGDHVVVKDAIESYAEELKSYERILVGSYTWGDGDLSDEIFGFYVELKDIDLMGKMGASFGPGDSNYEHFARGVEILEGTLKQQGCEIITPGLKIDSWSETEDEIKTKCASFAIKIINHPQHSKEGVRM